MSQYELQDWTGKVIGAGTFDDAPEVRETTEPFTIVATMKRDDGSHVDLGRFVPREDT